MRVSLLTTRGMIDMLEYRAGRGATHCFLEAARLAVEHNDDLGAARAHHILGSNLFAVPPHESVRPFQPGGGAGSQARASRAGGVVRHVAGLVDWVHAGDWSTAERLLNEAESLIDGGRARRLDASSSANPSGPIA